MKHPSHSFNVILMLLFLVSYCLSANTWSQLTTDDTNNIDSISQRAEALTKEASSIAQKTDDLTEQKKHLATRLAELTSRSIEPTEVERARLDVETQNAAMKSIKLDLMIAEQQKETLTSSIKSLKNNLKLRAPTQQDETIKNDIVQSEVNLSNKEKLLELELQHISVLNDRKQLVSGRLRLKEQWLTELHKAYQKQQEQFREQNFEELEKQLGEERVTWQKKVREYNSKLSLSDNNPSVSQSKQAYIEALLLEAEDSIFLIDARLKTAKMQEKLGSPAISNIKITADIKQLKVILEELKRLDVQANALIELLNIKHSLMKQRIEVVSKQLSLDTAGKKKYQQAESIYQQLIAHIIKQLNLVSMFSQNVQKQLKTINAVYVQQKRRGFRTRHHLPDTLNEWQPLVKEMNVLPEKTWQLVQETLTGLWAALLTVDPGKGLILILSGLLWSFACLSLGYLPRYRDAQFNEMFSQRILFISSDMLYFKRFSLLLGGLIFITAWLLDIISPGLVVIISIFAIWITANMIIRLSRWVLKSPIGLSNKQQGLHRLIVYFILFMSVSGFILLLGFLELITPELMDLFERMIMLLLLPPAYLTLRIRKLLIEKMSEKKEAGYWPQLVGLISLAIPIAILTAAVVGIAGYINLAWAVAWYLSIVIAVISVWLVARGLTVALAKTVEHKLIQRSERGIFWVKSIVEPVQLLIRLGLFFIAAWIIYRFFGGDPETGLNFKEWHQYTLFTFGGTPINGIDILSSIFLIALVFYLGRWTREITYGWLYSHVHDLGVRNSLSVFTQYAVIVVGLLITLNILGINLTSLAVFAGALGVGIGLGMQNIANNFISGLILLAERPIRTKDWVTIGDKEGEVAEIGMRSVTVTTWDNQDVIIPNSDLTSSAFINWTRTNSMVRTVLIIGIRYQDDPHKAQSVIEEAVTMQPEVSLEPKPRILLTEFAASSVNFRVQYFLDVMEFSRLGVKSKVMFAIWDDLKEAGIGIPFPQQDIYIKELPTNDSQFFPDSEQK